MVYVPDCNRRNWNTPLLFVNTTIFPGVSSTRAFVSRSPSPEAVVACESASQSTSQKAEDMWKRQPRPVDGSFHSPAPRGTGPFTILSAFQILPVCTEL